MAGGGVAGAGGDIVRLAERTDELPHTMAALRAGELSLDQAAEVARYVPARYDESAARVARCCTVKQLRQALPWYRDPKPDKPKPDGDPDPEVRGSVCDRLRRARATDAHIRLPEAAGAVVDQALKAMHEDLKRQGPSRRPRRCRARSRSTPRTPSSPWPRPRCAPVKPPGRAPTGTWSTPTSKPAPTGCS